MTIKNWRRYITRTLPLLLMPYITQAQGIGLNNELTPFAGTAQGNLIPSVQAIINIFLSLAALVAGIIIVYAGVKYITAGAGGDEDQAEEAKRAIVYAVIGLIVIGLSAAIVNFALRAIPA